MATELAKHVASITHALLAIGDLFDDPSVLAFDDIRSEMEQLEAVFKSKATVDAAFAFICERDDAGRTVGSKWASEYLRKKLGIEPKDAADRLARGRDFFGTPEVDAETAGGAGDATGDQGFDFGPDATGGVSPEEEERLREEARERQRQARKNSTQVGEEKQRIIRQELDKLLHAARGARPRLLEEAMREAPHRSAKDLRATVRRWVERENRKYADPANPNAGMEKRSARRGRSFADGTHEFLIRATRGDAALIDALMSRGLTPNSNLPDDVVEDYRTPEQRRYDQLMAALKHFDACERPAGGGCASVVVSVTLDQLYDANATTKFQTNTSIDVNAFDLVRLGMDGTADFVLAVDGATKLPLNLYRTRRTASLAQRIALLAAEGVCAWAGCSAPMSECEVHHIVSWLRGGDTNIDNLTALCRQHHRCNNDFMDHRHNTSHMERDPVTGRAGVSEPGEADLKFNNSDGAEHCAVNELRKHHRPEPPVPPGPPEPPPPRRPVEPPPWALDQDPLPPF